MLTAFFLICITLIPVIPVYIWFAVRNYGRLRFLFAFTAGVLALLAAGFIQSFFPAPDFHGRIEFVLFSVFIRISLVEEFSRFLALFILFYFFPNSRIPIPGFSSFASGHTEDPTPSFFGMPSGICAGLGFAAGESLFYGIADPAAAFLRVFTAAPLHAACGARIGSALGIYRKEPLRAAFLILAAVFIHGMYDFFILNPSIPWFLPCFLALSALISSLLSIRYRNTGPSRN